MTSSNKRVLFPTALTAWLVLALCACSRAYVPVQTHMGGRIRSAAVLRVRGTDPKTTEDANTVNLIGQELQELKEGINEFQSKAFEALYEKKVQWEPEASSVPTSEATVEAAAATDAFTTKTESDVKDSTAELGTSDMTTPAVIVADIPPVEVKAIEKVVAIEPVEEGPKVVVGKKRKAGVPNKPAMGFAPVVKPVAVETQIKEKEVEVKIGKVVEAVKVDKEEVKPVLDTKPSVAKVEPMLSKIQLTPGSKVSDEFDSSELQFASGSKLSVPVSSSAPITAAPVGATPIAIAKPPVVQEATKPVVSAVVAEKKASIVVEKPSKADYDSSELEFSSGKPLTSVNKVDNPVVVAKKEPVKETAEAEAEADDESVKRAQAAIANSFKTLFENEGKPPLSEQKLPESVPVAFPTPKVTVATTTNTPTISKKQPVAPRKEGTFEKMFSFLKSDPAIIEMNRDKPTAPPTVAQAFSSKDNINKVVEQKKPAVTAEPRPMATASKPETPTVATKATPVVSKGLFGGILGQQPASPAAKVEKKPESITTSVTSSPRPVATGVKTSAPKVEFTSPAAVIVKPAAVAKPITTATTTSKSTNWFEKLLANETPKPSTTTTKVSVSNSVTITNSEKKAEVAPSSQRPVVAAKTTVVSQPVKSAAPAVSTTSVIKKPEASVPKVATPKENKPIFAFFSAPPAKTSPPPSAPISGAVKSASSAPKKPEEKVGPAVALKKSASTTTTSTTANITPAAKVVSNPSSTVKPVNNDFFGSLFGGKKPVTPSVAAEPAKPVVVAKPAVSVKPVVPVKPVAKVEEKKPVVAATPKPVVTQPSKTVETPAKQAGGLFSFFSFIKPSLIPGKKGPNAMNANFMKQVATVLQNDAIKLKSFQKATDSFRSGNLEANVYFQSLVDLFDENNLALVVLPLATELPEKDLADKLRAAYEKYVQIKQQEEAAKKKKASPVGGLFSLFAPKTTTPSTNKPAAPIPAVKTDKKSSVSTPVAINSKTAPPSPPVAASIKPSASISKQPNLTTNKATPAVTSTISGGSIKQVLDRVPIAKKAKVESLLVSAAEAKGSVKDLFGYLVKDLGETKIKAIQNEVVAALPKDKAIEFSRLVQTLK